MPQRETTARSNDRSDANVATYSIKSLAVIVTDSSGVVNGDDTSVNDEVINAIRLMLDSPSVTEDERLVVLQACRSVPPVRPRHLVTMRRAAEILQVHPRTMRRYTQKGLLHPVRYSKRRFRYDLEEVEQFARQGIEATE
jgi:hypothetical protein